MSLQLIRSCQSLNNNLGLKDLKPAPLDLKQLYENETSSMEPIMIIINAGVDPSQELEDLAKSVIGLEKYHQVGTICPLTFEADFDDIWLVSYFSGSHGPRSTRFCRAVVETMCSERGMALFEKFAFGHYMVATIGKGLLRTSIFILKS